MYGDYAGAVAYFTARGVSGFPDTQAAGDALLLRASDSLDLTYTPKGSLKSLDQSRAWPRVGVVDCEGRSVGSDSVPQSIVNATYELAMLLAKNDAAVNSAQSQAIKKVKAGSVEVEYHGDNYTPPDASSLAGNIAVYSQIRCYVEGSRPGGHMIGLRKS